MSSTIARRRLFAGIAGMVGLIGTDGAAAWADVAFGPRLVDGETGMMTNLAYLA
jgi:hypothetical protein